ncbi:hypothetical protein GCM10010149_88120 [Nonomuraea roseoviolacea subsp. roseoviolacea]|uniref:hypothetical protein n=1 Tax=Nonomuraea roseoviolacea TaxID=103837 RepID=UPI0031DF8269
MIYDDDDERVDGILPLALLAVKMQPNSLGAETVREYLIGVLNHAFPVYSEDGPLRKPFEEWGKTLYEAQFELYEAFIRAKLIEGMVEPLEEVDMEAGNRLIRIAIQALGV